MTPAPCELLHDYIANDLAADEHGRFEAHLPGCLACRRIVHEERRLDNLLSSAVEWLDPVPPDLIARTRYRLRSVRRRRLAAGIAALAAAVVILAWLSRPLFLREVEPPAPINHEHLQPRLAEVAPPRANVRVRFPRAAGVIAIPVASNSPHVTVVQVWRFNQGAKHEHD